MNNVVNKIIAKEVTDYLCGTLLKSQELVKNNALEDSIEFDEFIKKHIEMEDKIWYSKNFEERIKLIEEPEKYKYKYIGLSENFFKHRVFCRIIISEERITKLMNLVYTSISKYGLDISSNFENSENSFIRKLLWKLKIEKVPDYKEIYEWLYFLDLNNHAGFELQVSGMITYTKNNREFKIEDHSGNIIFKTNIKELYIPINNKVI